ncbi:sugar/nucleoside kinase (ribokinase family) [Aureimonas jatrophae]|uniref:PfkB family carbohydrate kinase n=1 Tax=Aureimonas jatrophae TaxID=1166073 RepID=UPI001822C308|nr:sugar/nucleoside kinase (ribokinase family) [Aureimonas jatrophae]
MPFRQGASNPGVLRQGVGGACLNAAVALRSFGARVRLISARGGDPGALAVIDELAHHGIDDDAIVWLDRATASYTAVLDETGELVAAVADMAIYDMLTARALSRQHVRERLAAAPAVLMDANLSTPALETVCTYAKGFRAAIAVSQAKVARLRPVLDRLDVVFLSLAEARALTDCNGSILKIAHALRELGTRRAVVTDGPRAVTVIDGDSAFQQQPASIANLQDVTGAGDTVAAVTFLAHVAGQPLQHAICLGLAAAALRITDGLDQHSPWRVEHMALALPPPTRLSKDTVA